MTAITLSGDKVREYVLSCPKNYQVLQTIIRELEHGDYDVVHLHSALWSTFPLMSLLLTKIFKKETPTVLTTHAFDPTKQKKPIAILNQIIRRPSIEDSFFLLRLNTYYLVNRIISMTQTESTYLINQLNISKNKLRIVPNGVNFNRFLDFYQFREEHKINEKFIVLYVGQLIPEKGIFFLLEALKRMLSAGIDCRLVVFTYSDQSKILSFLSSSLQLGVLQKLKVFPQRNSKFNDRDLISAYRDCDVFVFHP